MRDAPARLHARCVLLALIVAAAGCAGLTGEGGAPGLLEIECVPADATLVIDGEPMGIVSGWRGGVVPVAPGKHQVEVRHPGYYPHLLDLTMRAGGSMRLTLDLIPQSDDLDDEEGAPGGPASPTSSLD